MFYGWVIVALAFVAQFVALGSYIQCYPVFLLPLSEEFGIGRAEAALAPAAVMISGIVIGPAIGRLVGRVPIRAVMLGGAAGMAVGFGLLSQVDAFWQYLVIFGLTGSVTLGALGMIACNSLIVNWFERRRSFALGVAMIGMSISGAVLIPIASWAVAGWGWRTVHLAFAATALLMMPLIAKLAVTRPSDMGLTPDGDEEPAEPTGDDASASALVAADPPATTRQLVSSPSLWLVAAACGLVFFGGTGIMNHGIAFAVDRGIEPLGAAALLSAISIGAAIGKLAFGWLADRLGERGAFAVAIGFTVVALFGYLWLGSYAALVAASALFGLGIGGVAPLQAALLAREFGTRDFAPAMGLIGALMIPFQITGPPLAGYIFDASGSYDLAIWIFIAATLVSGGMLAMMRPPAGREPAHRPVLPTRSRAPAPADA